MRAIQITSLDGPEAVELVDVPAPSQEGMVTIEVRAAGVAFPELLQSRGLYQIKPDLPFTPGPRCRGSWSTRRRGPASAWATAWRRCACWEVSPTRSRPSPT